LQNKIGVDFTVPTPSHYDSVSRIKQRVRKLFKSMTDRDKCRWINLSTDD